MSKVLKYVKLQVSVQRLVTTVHTRETRLNVVSYLTYKLTVFGLKVKNVL